MILILLGILAGMLLPVQTSVNTRLRKSVGSPFYASLISFIVAWLIFAVIIAAKETDLSVWGEKLSGMPLWIYVGGICGVTFLTGNVILFQKLGGVQTVVLPVLGQIAMGLVIDTFGLFRASVTPLSAFRVIGGVLVFVGVVIVSRAGDRQNGRIPSEKSGSIEKWLLRIFGVLIGMLTAVQTAVNGYLGKVLSSSVAASVISFTVGIIALGILCIFVFSAGKRNGIRIKDSFTAKPLWMWTGGILGALYFFANVYMSGILGTGLTVIVLLLGTTAGGLVVDHFGLLESPVKKMNAMKLIGVAVMIAGIVLIRVL